MVSMAPDPNAARCHDLLLILIASMEKDDVHGT
jgi:hypothetical protein